MYSESSVLRKGGDGGQQSECCVLRARQTLIDVLTSGGLFVFGKMYEGLERFHGTGGDYCLRKSAGILFKTLVRKAVGCEYIEASVW